MSPFQYHRPASLHDAIALLQVPGTRALGGGTDLLALARDGVDPVDVVVDLRRLPGSDAITPGDDGSLHIGASARLATLARHAMVREAFPLLAESCAAAGTPALRTMATLAGNLCQRPRCWYFRHGWSCHKTGGSGCPAVGGDHTYHAILGAGPCAAAHPSDPAVALTALDAVVHLAGPAGPRAAPMHAFLAPAAHARAREVALAPGEVVTGVSLPAAAHGGVQHFEKLTQRAAFDLALVSVAAQRRQDGDVRLVLGGVAPHPWRVADSVEEDVASGGLGDDDIETLAQRALYDARPLDGNTYKVTLAAALLRRAMAAVVDR